MIGVPGDREVDLQAGRRPRSTPATATMFDDFARRPGPGQRLHRPAGAARASGTWSTRGSSPGTAWLTGANEPGRHAVNVVARPRLRAGRHDRGRRRAGRRPVPGVRRRAHARAAASRSGTSSSSAAGTPTRSASTCSARTASRYGPPWAATGSASPGRWRRSPSSTTTSAAWSGRARWRRPTCTWSRPAGTTSRRPRRARRAELAGAGLRVLVDDRRGCRPASSSPTPS